MFTVRVNLAQASLLVVLSLNLVHEAVEVVFDDDLMLVVLHQL
jgi:hypothetical protein